LGVETLLIELERRLAFSLKTQIQIHLHGASLFDDQFLACYQLSLRMRARTQSESLQSRAKYEG
jgi:hypothetical protein